MIRQKNPKFIGYEHLYLDPGKELFLDIPEKIRIIDTGLLVDVNLECMILDGDARKNINFKLLSLTKNFGPITSQICIYLLLHALNGRRKVSTVLNWANAISHFSSQVSEFLTSPISTITFEMVNWYNKGLSTSQQKLLRAPLQFWCGLHLPGIAKDLQNYLRDSKPPRPRST